MRKQFKVSSGLLVLLLAGILLGCGGSKKEEAKKKPAPAGPAPTQVAVAAPAPAPAAAAEQKAPEPEVIYTPDDFQLVDMKLKWDVLPPAPTPPPAKYEVASLAPGITSADFTLAPQETVPPAPSPIPAAQSNTGPQWWLPAGFVAVRGAPIDQITQLPKRITSEKEPVEMVLILPGLFTMGENREGSPSHPQHAVLLEHPFYMDVAEVTIERYNAYRAIHRKGPDARTFKPPVNEASADASAPALGISFFDARLYAKWCGKELPTEAQWERAARGPKGFQYPWGNGRPIWHAPRLPGQIDPVMSFPADRSPEGVFDLLGNAREWCADWYHEDTYRQDLTKGEPVRNPAGPKGPMSDSQRLHPIRGDSQIWSLTVRIGHGQTEGLADVGFRCVMNPMHGESPKSETDKGDKKTPSKTAPKKTKVPSL